MTDRVNALTVILGRDIREDDVQALIQAIRMMRDVLDVKMNVSDLNGKIAEMRVRHDLLPKIIELFKDQPTGGQS